MEAHVISPQKRPGCFSSLDPFLHDLIQVLFLGGGSFCVVSRPTVRAVRQSHLLINKNIFLSVSMTPSCKLQLQLQLTHLVAAISSIYLRLDEHKRTTSIFFSPNILLYPFPYCLKWSQNSIFIFCLWIFWPVFSWLLENIVLTRLPVYNS